MPSLATRIEHLFFRHVDARGFGLMRIAWAATILVYWIGRGPDILRFFSEQGILPLGDAGNVMQVSLRIAAFDRMTDPTIVLFLYALLLASAACALVGYRPRISVILTTVLLFSFHERNGTMLGGGDTVLRLVAFILCIAPVIDAFSVSRLHRQWHHWRQHHQLLPHAVMPAWPKILLTWQVIVIYFTCVWDKLQGQTWLTGTAVGAIMHQTHFARTPRMVADVMTFASPFLSYATLAFEFSWILLLIPNIIARDLPWRSTDRVRRFLIFSGILFHGSIFLTMDVGSFVPAMFTMYCGLLTASDSEMLYRIFRRRDEKSIIVLFDGRCGLCRRSIATLLTFDWLKTLKAVDFNDETRRKEMAPTLSAKDLNRAMHIRLPDGSYEKGFAAFRRLSHELPPLWLLRPFLWIPGMSPIGEAVYAHIATRRERCAHENCEK